MMQWHFGKNICNFSGDYDLYEMKKRAGVIFLLIIATLSVVCNPGEIIRGIGKEDAGKVTANVGKGPEKREFFGMDTHIVFTAYGEAARESLEEAEHRMKELEGLWSVTDKNSDIYRVNHSNGRETAVSRETAEAATYALEMAEKTEGSLEPTIYPVLTAWGFTTEKHRVPEAEELAQLLMNVGYEKVTIQEDRIWMPEGMEMDLGSVGKGYAGDIIAEMLEERGIVSALLDIGGNIQAIGSRPNGSDWRLGIRSPFGDGT